MKPLTLLLLTLVLGGCAGEFNTLPKIPGHHWNRALGGPDLYVDATGERAAGLTHGYGNWQICRFEQTRGGDRGTCKQFETAEAALRDLERQYQEDLQ